MSTTTTAARLLRSRRLVRAPIWIYKARAGALFGSRLLMIEHIGRKSGLQRNVVLEVVDHPTSETYIVPSGFGEKAQWFRNVRANPRVRVYVGSHSPAFATARVLDQDEADSALASYRQRHPRAWARFKPVVEETLGGPIAETNTDLPLVELRLDRADHDHRSIRHRPYGFRTASSSRLGLTQAHNSTLPPWRPPCGAC